VAHALVEGIAQVVAACVSANAEAAGLPLSQVMTGGTLATSDLLLQMQADLTGVPACRTHQAAHASLRGIAYLAGSHGLLWDDLSHACAPLACKPCSSRASTPENALAAVPCGRRACAPSWNTAGRTAGTDQ
jgi:glycerol kinase